MLEGSSIDSPIRWWSAPVSLTQPAKHATLSVSLTPSWMSCGPRKSACPPSIAMPVSVDTLRTHPGMGGKGKPFVLKTTRPMDLKVGGGVVTCNVTHRVRVLRFWKIMETLLPAKGRTSWSGDSEDGDKAETQRRINPHVGRSTSHSRCSSWCRRASDPSTAPAGPSARRLCVSLGEGSGWVVRCQG